MIKTMIRTGDVNFGSRGKDIQRLAKGTDRDRDLYQGRAMQWSGAPVMRFELNSASDYKNLISDLVAQYSAGGDLKKQTTTKFKT